MSLQNPKASKISAFGRRRRKIWGEIPSEHLLALVSVNIEKPGSSIEQSRTDKHDKLWWFYRCYYKTIPKSPFHPPGPLVNSSLHSEEIQRCFQRCIARSQAAPPGSAVKRRLQNQYLAPNPASNLFMPSPLALTRSSFSPLHANDERIIKTSQEIKSLDSGFPFLSLHSA